MKKMIGMMGVMAMMAACGGTRAVNVTSGEKTLDEKYVPYGCAELVGVECLMYSGNGTLSLDVVRTMGETVTHETRVNNYAYTTNVTYSATLYDLDIACEKIQYGDAFYRSDEISTNSYTLSGCDNSWTMSKDGDNYYLQRDASGGVTGLSARVWYDYKNSHVDIKTPVAAGTTNVSVVVSGSATYYDTVVSVTARVDVAWGNRYDRYVTNVTSTVTSVTTNRWTEGVTRSWTNSVISGVSLSGSKYIEYLATPVHLFEGDVIRVTSPVTSENPGRVRAIIKDDTVGTFSPFLNEE